MITKVNNTFRANGFFGRPFASIKGTAQKTLTTLENSSEQCDVTFHVSPKGACKRTCRLDAKLSLGTVRNKPMLPLTNTSAFEGSYKEPTPAHGIESMVSVRVKGKGTFREASRLANIGIGTLTMNTDKARLRPETFCLFVV